MTTTKRILIAEDETIIRLDLRATLEARGYDVCGEARDGVEAVELAEELEPDLILMDVKMPRLDGIEAARRILDRQAVPIVMMTAFGQEELIAGAVDAGVPGTAVPEQDVIPALVAAGPVTRSLPRSSSRRRRCSMRSRPARRSSGQRGS
jgi:response regulator NasT